MEPGSVVVLEIGFNSEDDFALEFYVEREKTQRFEKSELVRVTTEEGVRWYAMVDAAFRGNLMCRAEIVDKEAHCGERAVVATGYTGYAIGDCLCGKGGGINCQGYTFTFKCVANIPKDINSKIYYGVIKQWIADYKYITEEMVHGLTQVEVGAMDVAIDAAQGDRLVVLIPYEESLTAKKVSGIGGVSAALPFETKTMGENGELTMYVDSIKYRVYGEFVIVRGIYNINIR